MYHTVPEMETGVETDSINKVLNKAQVWGYMEAVETGIGTLNDEFVNSKQV